MNKHGKSNIDILKDYVAGVRPFVQVGYTGQQYIKRKVGERWTDNKGVQWVQKESGPQRVNSMADAVREARGIDKCKKCKKEIRWGGRADHILYRKTGLCTDCLVDYETKLRIAGIHVEYEIMKMASNDLGFLKDVKAKISEVLNFFLTDEGDITMLCNSEGFTERWKNTNREQIIKDAKRDLKLVRKRIAFLTKIKAESKKKFLEGAKKYNLETYV